MRITPEQRNVSSDFRVALKQVEAGVCLEFSENGKMGQDWVGCRVFAARMKLLAEGLSVKEIAYNLGISYKTVHTFRTMTMQKLDINNIADLTRFAIKAHIIEI